VEKIHLFQYPTLEYQVVMFDERIAELRHSKAIKHILERYERDHMPISRHELYIQPPLPQGQIIPFLAELYRCAKDKYQGEDITTVIHPPDDTLDQEPLPDNVIPLFKNKPDAAAGF
jgi:hypothetical protein